MVFIVLAVLLLVNLPCFGGKNLLKNADFEKVSKVGLPLYWEIRPFNKKLFSFKDKIARMETKGGVSKINLIQYGIPFVAQKSYTVSFKVKSPTESMFRAYVEWTYLKNGKLKYRAINAKFQKAGKNWKTISFQVKVPGNTKKTYLVFNIKKPAVLEVSQIKIVPSSLLKNADFSLKDKKDLPKYWQLIATSPACLEVNEGTAKLNPPASGRALLVQRNLPLIPGKSYQVNYEVRSLSNSKYRIYSEWHQKVDGKNRLRAVNGHYQNATTKWTKNSYKFEYPAKGKKVYIVLQGTYGKSGVEFRNITIEPTVENTIRTLNGKWTLPNGAKVFVEADKNTTLELTNGKKQKSKAQLKGIPLVGGQRYSLTYKARGKGKSGTSTGYFPFRVSWVFNDSIDHTGIWNDTWESPQNKKMTFTAPAGSNKVSGTIVFESKGNGAVLFDSFKLTKLPPAKPEKVVLTIEEPFFRDTIFADSGEKDVRGKIKTTNDIKSISIELSDAANKILKSRKIENKGTEIPFSFTIAKLPYGEYKITIKCTDNNNKQFQIRRKISKLAPAKMTVNCRPDRTIYINNKPFFPILFWQLFKDLKPVSMYHAARNGVNSFMSRAHTETAAKKVLDLANSFNMKVIINMGRPTLSSDGSLGHWTHRISGIITPEIANHPALLGYFLVDEPAWVGEKFSILKAGYDILKELDPYHPIWINAAPRGGIETHKKYSSASDIYGVDIYPVPYPSSHSGLADKGLTSVGKYTEFMNKACSYRKPIWMALQAFAWGAWTDKPRNKLVYPSYRESRFMAYDAILSGANAITYWGAQHVEDRKFASSLYRLTKELWQLSGLFVLQNSNFDVTSSNSKIKLKAWKYNNNVYIIALNQSAQKQASDFSEITGVNKLELVNESRSVSVKNGKFEDNFEPFEVHIYKSGKLPTPPLPLLKYDKNLENQDFFKREAIEKYNGQANWIWEDTSKNKAWNRIGLVKKFEISRNIKKATVIITADDNYELYMNGEKVGSDTNNEKGGWKTAEKYDCTKLLKKGSNTISITASDAGLIPCGVLLDLSITYSDNTTQNIITDKSWKAITTPSKNWFKNNITVSQSGVAIIAPYGSGAWARKLKVK